MINMNLNENGEVIIEGLITDVNWTRNENDEESFNVKIPREIIEVLNIKILAHDQSHAYEHGHDDWRKKRED